MQQKYLKNAGLIALITILSMIPPLSTDLYMPALPEYDGIFQYNVYINELYDDNILYIHGNRYFNFRADE